MYFLICPSPGNCQSLDPFGLLPYPGACVYSPPLPSRSPHPSVPLWRLWSPLACLLVLLWNLATAGQLKDCEMNLRKRKNFGEKSEPSPVDTMSMSLSLRITFYYRSTLFTLFLCHITLAIEKVTWQWGGYLVF